VKVRTLISAVICGGLTVLFVFFLSVKYAGAQEADIPLLPSGGVYPVKFMAPVDLDLYQVCCVRADAVPIAELGCIDAVPDAVGTLEVTLASTPGDDAEIRCYATDTSDLVSDYSPNAGIVDFTPPGVPVIVP
jgi:hypothetical protein